VGRGFTGDNGWLIDGQRRSERSRRAGLGRRAGAVRAHRRAARADLLRRDEPASRTAGCRSSSSRSAPCCPIFSARRMVKDTCGTCICPAVRRETVTR
jgi:hypothetical protein